MDRDEAIFDAIESANKAMDDLLIDKVGVDAFLASLDASGFAVVPRKATLAMTRAAAKQMAEGAYSADIWYAMLAASRSEKEKAG